MKIQIQDIRKSYHSDFHLQIDNLDIHDSQKINLIGKNGSGKSSLLLLMIGLIAPERGKILIDGMDISRTDKWKSKVSAFFDESFLFDFLTPTEYFGFIYKFKSVNEDRKSVV